VSHSPDSSEKFVPPKSLDEMTPEQEEALEAHLQRVHDEKREALKDPGPGWKEWFLYRGAKAYVILGFLIVDAWVVAWFIPFTWIGAILIGPLFAAILYIEAIAYLYLWYRPSSDAYRSQRRKGQFVPTWIRPVPFGRWTPEAADVRSGRLPLPADGGPEPSEFL